MVQVGIDIVRIEQFSQLSSGWAPFYRRVYTATERTAFGKDPVLLALCLTAKEAVAKVLGTGLSLGAGEEVDCTEIEVTCDAGGQYPSVRLSGSALKIKDELKLSRVVLFWYHDLDCAFSVAGAGDADVEQQLTCALKAALCSLIKCVAFLSRKRSTSHVGHYADGRQPKKGVSANNGKTCEMA